MLILADFIIDQNRWFGNYVVPVMGIATLFYYAGKKGRPLWITGAAIFTALFLILFAGFVVYDRLYWKPTPGAFIDFNTEFLFIWFSALPIQTGFNWLLGEDNFVEEQLLIPIAVLMWSVVGATFGMIIAKIKKWSRTRS